MVSSSSGDKEEASQNPAFKPGSIVEINSNDEGFRGSWFLGKVVKQAPRNGANTYVVEYDKLFKDEAGKKQLQEVLDYAQLRPVAPRERKRKFKFSEKVDAYHSDGWWEGVITKECEDGRFGVYFRSSKEQIVFGEEDLRLHREWVNGEWLPPLEEEKKEDIQENMVDGVETKRRNPKPENQETPKRQKAGGVPAKMSIDLPEKFTKGMEVEVSIDEEGFQGAWLCATIIDMPGNDKCLVEYKHLRAEDDSGFLQEVLRCSQVRPCPPQMEVVDRYRLMEEVDAWYHECWWVGVVTKILINCRYKVYFRDHDDIMVFQHSDLRPHQDWMNGRWVSPSKILKL